MFSENLQAEFKFFNFTSRPTKFEFNDFYRVQAKFK